MSGAISASGPSTNSRSRKRGCGTVQAILGHDRVTVQNQIEIERPRSHRIGPRPAPLFFDLQQSIEQIARRQRRPSHDRGIQIRTVLLADAERLVFRRTARP